MTAPQFDVLRPSPLDLGGVLGGAFKVFFKERFGQFALLALVPIGLTLVLLAAAIVPLVLGIIASIRDLQFSGLIVLGVLLIFTAVVVGYLAQIKIQAMITLGSYDVIHQRRSTAGDLFRRTGGVVGRVLLLVLVVLAAVFVVYGLIIGVTIAITFGAIAAEAPGGGFDPGAVAGTLVAAYLVMIVLLIGLGLLTYYLIVRFLYFLPALAVENLSAVDSLKRSWRLTKGSFLRTLGYILVASVLVWLASYLVSLIGQLMLLPASSQAADSAVVDPTGWFLIMLPGLITLTGLSFAVQVLTLPFLTSYVTVMYVDQLRRNELPAGFHPGAPAPAAGRANYPQQPYGAPGQWQQRVHPPQPNPVHPPQPNEGPSGQQPPARPRGPGPQNQ